MYVYSNHIGKMKKITKDKKYKYIGNLNKRC